MQLDTAKFLLALGLAWQAALKKTKVKSNLLTHINMLLIVKKVLEEEYATLFINMQNLITSIRKIMKKKKRIIIYSILGCK